ncbi:hypothetical protein J3Q64DRAFT_1393529 [Phycomyces blakesleeanus]|uniref:Uncharacterized protein n=1 Tax=Phycomyces blakesleeanus TaxID=4837 RepID=A0ABR3B410_PHYBL
MAATDTNSSKGREDFILDNPTSMNTEQIKDIEPQSQDYWDSTVFYLDIHAEAKPPGSLADEQYLTADLTNPINNHNNNNHNNNTDSLITNNNNNSSNNVNNVSNDNNININININNNDNLYGYLRTNFPHWRRILSHDYMRNTDLHDPISPNLSANPAQLVLIHLDDHAWASVQHYLQASRVQHIPDLYHRFTLDSNDPLGRATAAEVVEFIKSQHSLEPIPAEALRRALLAKFVQNEDLARALVATGGAKLVSRSHDNAIVVEDALMWVRTVLRREHENTLKVLTSQKIGESKQEEVKEF